MFLLKFNNGRAPAYGFSGYPEGNARSSQEGVTKELEAASEIQ
jgi:hypothetical protein